MNPIFFMMCNCHLMDKDQATGMNPIFFEDVYCQLMDKHQVMVMNPIYLEEDCHMRDEYQKMVIGSNFFS